MAYACDHCELVFSDKTELLLHVETITDEKPFQCADCDKHFSSANNFRIHLATHNENGSNTRDSNDASVNTDTRLIDLYTQSGNKDCVKNSTNSIEFSRHIQYRSGQNTFQCNGCDNTFSKISNLKRHKLTQAGPKIHKCKHCEKNVYR